MSLLHIDEKRCTRDGFCAAVCPVGLIAGGQGLFPTVVEEAEKLCVGCGHCVAVCPTGSLSHQAMAVVDCPPLRMELELSGEQVAQFLRARRSIRTYRQKAVSRETLADLLALARYAPSGHNRQNARWLVLGVREELASLSTLVVQWMYGLKEQMPELAASWHLEHTLSRWEAGHDVVLRGAPAVIVAYADENDRLGPSSCTLALSYLELAASGQGLGCCWAGFFNAAAVNYPPMREALHLPEGCQSYGAMMVGYPAIRFHRLPTRKSPQITWRMD